MTRKAARALYSAIVREEGMADPGKDDFESIATAVVDRLITLADVLNDQLEAIRDKGDLALERALTGAKNRVNLLIISVNQELIAFLDNAPNIAKAKAQIEDVTDQLEAEATQTAKTTKSLKKTAAVLDGLAKLVGLL